MWEFLHTLIQRNLSAHGQDNNDWLVVSMSRLLAYPGIVYALIQPCFCVYLCQVNTITSAPLPPICLQQVSPVLEQLRRLPVGIMSRWFDGRVGTQCFHPCSMSLHVSLNSVIFGLYDLDHKKMGNMAQL